MKLNVSAFALAFGIWWGVSVFVLTWWLIMSGPPAAELGLIGRIYIGYAITPFGSLVGLVWGFICGVICGGILAWLYNFLAERIGASTETYIGKPT